MVDSLYYVVPVEERETPVSVTVLVVEYYLTRDVFSR